MKYSILIIEDEFPMRELLKGYLASRIEAGIPEIATTGKEALELLQNKTYDIIFLDIRLPDMSGLAIMQQLSGLKNSYVIFSTAYNQHAVEALDAGAVDYLLKPYSPERFNQALDKALVFLKNSRTNLELTLKITESATRVNVPLNEIIYLSSNGKHTVFHTINSDYETPGLLKDYLDELPVDLFLRIHKQYVVNRDYISGITYVNGGSWSLLLKDSDDTTLPVGKIYADDIKRIFNI